MSKPILSRLFEHGSHVKDRAYVPYSNHPVGSAILADDGNIYAGCNVETANYKGTCAEAGAIAQMIAHGGKTIQHIAVIGPGTHLCTPCGDCRQRIREFATAATQIHVFDQAGQLLKNYTMEELLPDSFGPDNITQIKAASSH